MDDTPQPSRGQGGLLPVDDPLSAAGRLALIERIYQLALEPEAYDDFMEQWDDQVARSMDRLGRLRDTTPQAVMEQAGIRAHFDRVSELLGALPAPRADGAPAVADDAAPDQGVRIEIDANGRIRRVNDMAARLLACGDEMVGSFIGQAAHEVLADFVDPADLARLRAMAPTPHRPDAGDAPVLLRITACADTAVDSASRFLVARMRPGLAGDGPLIVLTDAAPVWPEGMEELLADTFDFSPAESAVAAALFRGQDAETIAENRGSKVSTVRTQIKSLLAKSGAHGRIELLRILYTLTRFAKRQDDSATQDVASDRTVFYIRGREIEVITHGPETGRPVIYFHGLLDGCEMPSSIKRQLARRNLRIIAPVRPWFRDADHQKTPVAGALEQFADDVIGVIDRLGLGRVVLASYTGGSVYCAAAAGRLGDRAMAMVGISAGVPIRSDSQIRQMAPRARIMARTALYLPAMLPLVLKAGIRQFHAGGTENFSSAFYAQSPCDLAQLENIETHDILHNGYRKAVSQGHRSFQIDGYHILRDWSALIDQSTCPMALLHGAEDPIVAISSVRDFCADLGGRCRLIELSDTGQLVLYQHPEKVLDALAGAFDQAGV